MKQQDVAALAQSKYAPCNLQLLAQHWGLSHSLHHCWVPCPSEEEVGALQCLVAGFDSTGEGCHPVGPETTSMVASLLISYLQSAAAQVMHDQTPCLQPTPTVKNRHMKDKDMQGD